MAGWTPDELETLEREEELELSSERNDGTLGDPTTIWVVRVGDEAYVRAVNGREGPWFLGTQVRRRGRVKIGSVERDVAFEDADPALEGAVDAEYRSKYRAYPQDVEPVLTPKSKASTLRLVPR